MNATHDEIARVIDSLAEFDNVKRELDDLKTGRTVLIPIDEDHARFMITIAQGYLDRHHEQTFNALAREY